MSGTIKKFVMVNENVTPGMLKASHRQYWHQIKDKPLRVVWEDKTTVHVKDEAEDEHDIPKYMVQTVKKGELVG